MVYTVSLYLSLAIFAIGSLVKILNWFRVTVGVETKDISTWMRLGTAIKGTVAAVFSRRVLSLIKVFFMDVLLQGWLLKKSFFRWFSHICMYGGFVFLLVMHGLENLVTTALFPGYASTLNPYMFLRNLAAGAVLLGIALALYRRLFTKGPRPKTTVRDGFVLAVLAIIIVTGILLEGVKITSHHNFQEMVEEYAGLDTQEDTSDLRALEAYWIDAFGIVSPDAKGLFDAQLLAEGKELHAISCADCHSRPHWAFIGYGVSGAIRPIAPALDRADIQTFLLYTHFMACFLGLACLPFSKFFHLIATPVYLLINVAMEEEKAQPAGLATKRAMELDACTHCGECTMHCSVAITYRKIPNPNILPSEKLIALRTLASGKALSRKTLARIQEGNHICTDCHRCTDVCPVGINLEAQWRLLGDDLTGRGFPKLEAWAKKEMHAVFDVKAGEGLDLRLAGDDGAVSIEPWAWPEMETFSVCFGCQTCTNVCPVVACFDDPKEHVDLFPHQIMHALALGRTDLALGSRMLWDCVTCYMCQEECPQGVRVTDVLYGLKNCAFRQLQTEGTTPLHQEK